MSEIITPSPLRSSWAVILLVAAVLGSAAATGAPAPPYLHAPSVDTYAKHDPAGVTILPNGRHLKPVGKHLPLARFPHGLAMSRDGNKLFVASDSVGHLLSRWQTESPQVVELKPVKLE